MVYPEPSTMAALSSKTRSTAPSVRSSRKFCARPSPPMIWRFRSPHWPRKQSANIPAPPTRNPGRDLQGNRQRLRLRIPCVSLAGLTSIIDFRAEATAEAKRLVLEKMFDNSLLQEIEKEMTSKR
jgi:hypothetical protein